MSAFHKPTPGLVSRKSCSLNPHFPAGNILIRTFPTFQRWENCALNSILILWKLRKLSGKKSRKNGKSGEEMRKVRIYKSKTNSQFQFQKQQTTFNLCPKNFRLLKRWYVDHQACRRQNFENCWKTQKNLLNVWC